MRTKGATAARGSAPALWLLAAALLAGATAAGALEVPGAAPTSAPAAGAPAAANPAAAAAEPQPPVRISADAAEYFNKEGRVVFAGNVVAIQSDSTLAAERMEVSFSQPEGAEAKPAAGIGTVATGRRITTIVALKKVSFRQVDPDTQKERYATGEKAVYDADERIVTMTGSPRLWEGKNVIVGEEMRFHLQDKKVTIKGKVNLTVFPEETKPEGKP